MLSARGRVLFFIALHPGATLQETAHGLNITDRAAWTLLRDLRDTGMVFVAPRRRSHHYHVNLDAPFLHPTMQGYTLRPILGQIAAQACRSADELALLAESVSPTAALDADRAWLR